MSKINTKAVNNRVTHGGAKASAINSEQELRRTMATCMLWEDQFYEGGESAADRIARLIPLARPEFAAACAFEARTKMKLRHVPLLIVREMARHEGHKALVSKLLPDIIQRADELSEFMAIYWKDGKCPISAQVKKGLAAVFKKFDGYSLKKYNGGDKEVKLRDVLFLVHSKPADAPGDKFTKLERKAGVERDMSEGEKLYADLVNGSQSVIETWETKLSAGEDKRESFESLMSDKKLGAMAFLRNLRNMKNSGVSLDEVKKYAKNVKVDKILPFRFLAAARAVPGWEDVIEPMMLRCLEGQPKLTGKTVFVVDTSGSMGGMLSGKSELNRLDTAAALSILIRELCEEVTIYCTAGDDYKRVHATMEVPARRGFALSSFITGSEVRHRIGGGGIFLRQCLDWIEANEKRNVRGWTAPDRVIILTDEQDCDTKLSPDTASAFGKNNYIINVASYQNGIAYNKFTHINGWSEAVLDFIRLLESENMQETA